MVTFQLTDEQINRIKDWAARLPPHPVGAIGGRLEYRFIETSLGTIAKVFDCITQEELDLTDYASW